MSSRILAGAAIGIGIGIVAAPAVALALSPSPLAPSPAPIALAAAPAADPVGAHAAIEQARERLSEIDATISALEADADKLDSAGRQRVHDAVATLRTIRETYRKEIDGVVAQGRQLTADQITVARAALAAPWTQFERDLDQDVAAIKLDAGQRKALIEARIRAEQAYWQGVMADLKSSATNLTAEQQAAIDSRIARVKARADEAQTRLTKLAHAGHGAWSALKRGFVDSRRIFEDTYGAAEKGTP
ncbi:MAG TPA: hypothetical protein VH414_14710 [Lichenihabitans sp.]|jgi:chromosome segregation ATPase|nr:hypothetical protein [Lichenihabitans sp.]